MLPEKCSGGNPSSLPAKQINNWSSGPIVI